MRFLLAMIFLLVCATARAQETQTLEHVGQSVGVVRCDKGTFVGTLAQASREHCADDGTPTTAVSTVSPAPIIKRTIVDRRPIVIVRAAPARRHYRAHARRSPGPFDFLFHLTRAHR